MASPERKSEITKQDYPYQVVGKYFGAKDDAEALKIWNNVTKNNETWLAKMTGTGKWSGTEKENTTIANNLRANKVEPFYDYEKNATKIDNFDEIQKIYNSKNLSDQMTFEYYIANLDEGQIATLNTLSVDQKALFISEECQSVDVLQTSIKQKVESGGAMENKNLAVMKELMDMNEKLEHFMQKYSLETPMLANFRRKEGKEGEYNGFIDDTTEQEFKIFLQEQQATDEYKKIVEKYDEKIAEEQYRQLFIIKNIDTTLLSKEAKYEFAGIVVDICKQAKEFGVDLVKMGFDTIYNGALNVYQSTDMYGQLSMRVMSDQDFNTYFNKAENKVEQLVPKDKKTLSYYKNIAKLYPDAIKGDKSFFSEAVQYLNEDMSVKESAPQNFKDDFAKNKGIIMENIQGYEKRLLNHSNAIVQQSAITQCLTALQKTMDIDISNQENLLDKFALDQNVDAIVSKGEQLLLNVKGNINGKQISLAYDLASGKVYYQKYMQKAGYKDTDPIVIGSVENKETDLVPLVTLPTLGDVVKKGQEMSENGEYEKLMDRSENLLAYDKNFEEELKKSYTVSGSLNHEIGKDMIKKNILEDMIVQKMMKIGDREIPAGQEITNTQFPSIYNFYNYLYRSFQYYTMKPMVQLENWNTNMNDILTAKEQSKTQSPQELLLQEEGSKNQKRFVLHGIVNQKIMGLDNTQTRNQNVESNLLAFFQCFEKNIGGMGIVDIQMMNDYLKAAKGNTDQESVGVWKKNPKFNSLYRDFQGQFGANMADINLNEQMIDEGQMHNNLPEK